MENHNVGSLVVTDRDDRILGMITDRDIALAIGRGNAVDTAVDRICTHSVVTIGTSASRWQPTLTRVLSSEGARARQMTGCPMASLRRKSHRK